MPADRGLNIAVLAGMCVLVVVAQLVTLRRADRWATLGDVLRLLQRPLAGRMLLTAGWVWLGWHAFVRGDW